MDLHKIKHLFSKFLHSEDSKIAMIRDVLYALTAVLLVLLILWSYTGQWFAAPMVAIESGSMEHPNPPFGRLGTIDAGDMVLVKKTTTRQDITTHGGNYRGAQSKGEAGHQTYGRYGDVIIFYPDGKFNQKQIIHRAMCWVDVYETNGEYTYTIKEFGIENETELLAPQYGLKTFTGNALKPRWTDSGFLTKGDNNEIIDQAGGIATDPIKTEWITGKARLEIPWLGTINLFFEDLLNNNNTISNVHEDSLICLFILIGVLISIPIILDLKDYFKDKNSEEY